MWCPCMCVFQLYQKAVVHENLFDDIVDPREPVLANVRSVDANGLVVAFWYTPR